MKKIKQRKLKGLSASIHTALTRPTTAADIAAQIAPPPAMKAVSRQLLRMRKHGWITVNDNMRPFVYSRSHKVPDGSVSETVTRAKKALAASVQDASIANVDQTFRAVVLLVGVRRARELLDTMEQDVRRIIIGGTS